VNKINKKQQTRNDKNKMKEKKKRKKEEIPRRLNHHSTLRYPAPLHQIHPRHC